MTDPNHTTTRSRPDGAASSASGRTHDHPTRPLRLRHLRHALGCAESGAGVLRGWGVSEYREGACRACNQGITDIEPCTCEPTYSRADLARVWTEALNHAWLLADPAYTVDGLSASSMRSVLVNTDVTQAMRENPYRTEEDR